MAGSFEFTKKGTETVIYATPYWEDVDGISVEVHYDDDDEILKPVKFKLTGDFDKDTATYIKIMKQLLPKLEKKYA